MGMEEPTVMEKTESGWLETETTSTQDAHIKAEIDRMWGHTEVPYGRRTCQFVREGRLRQGEWDLVCKNWAIHGEKYCQEHMLRTPSRIFWFLLGAAAMYGFLIGWCALP